MGKKHLILLLWLLLLLMFSVGHTHCTRSYTQVFNMKQPRSHQQHYSPRTILGFLPKSFPIPPSGPSKEHNDIGLQSSQSSPWWSLLKIIPSTHSLLYFHSSNSRTLMGITVWHVDTFWWLLSVHCMLCVNCNPPLWWKEYIADDQFSLWTTKHCTRSFLSAMDSF